MGGLFNLFKNMGKAMDAKADAAAADIAEKNMVEFGRQDIEKMRSDLRSIKGNIGSVKGEIAVLEDKLKALRMKMAKHDADAVASAEANLTDLAEQNANAAAAVETQIKSLELALTTQKSVLDDQIKNKNELAAALQQAETNLVTIKAMTDAANSNEKLAQISTASGTSALASFKEREEAAKKRLIKSKALKDDGEDSLEAATAKALGKSAGSDRLAQLLAAKKSA